MPMFSVTGVNHRCCVSNVTLQYLLLLRSLLLQFAANGRNWAMLEGHTLVLLSVAHIATVHYCCWCVL